MQGWFSMYYSINITILIYLWRKPIRTCQDVSKRPLAKFQSS